MNSKQEYISLFWLGVGIFIGSFITFQIGIWVINTLLRGG